MPKTVMMKIEIDDKVKNEERNFYNEKDVKILKERYDRFHSLKHKHIEKTNLEFKIFY